MMCLGITEINQTLYYRFFHMLTKNYSFTSMSIKACLMQIPKEKNTYEYVVDMFFYELQFEQNTPEE